MQESEQMIRPLEEIFDRISADNLRNYGVKGVIPIELSIQEIMSIAQSKGHETHSVDLLSKADIGMYWINPSRNSLTIVTKNEPNGEKSAYIFDDDLQRFKELFFEE